MSEQISSEMTADRRKEMAGMSLEVLREQYRYDLFEDHLPFWEEHGIDHEFGGFMGYMDADGHLLNTDKYMWYQGRGLWTYAYLYNHFGGDHYLEVARQTWDFLNRHGRDEQGDWVMTLDREGHIVRPASARGYGAMFVAEGLQEYHRATGDPHVMDLAIQSLWRAVELIDDPDRNIPEEYLPHTYPGLRTQGSHMVILRVLTQMLDQVSDPALEHLSDRMVHAIVHRFWHPEYRLNNEVLNHQYERPDDVNEDFIYLGHGIETLWMVLSEALRRKDRALFDLAAGRFRRHMEVAWDDVYGGFLRAMHVHGAYTFNKVLWLQEEVLIGTMILMEHTDWTWPAWWFERAFRYVRGTSPLEPGHSLWMLPDDRKVTYVQGKRKDNYHHPRHLMLNLLALERMIERGGREDGK